MSKKNKVVLFLMGGMLALVGTFSACGQDYNTFSGDEALSAGLRIDCSDPANAELCAAATALQKRCYSCHQAWAGYTSSQEFIDSGLVIAGNAAGSRLITKTVN